jgi:hypothetical protein
MIAPMREDLGIHLPIKATLTDIAKVHSIACHKLMIFGT